MSEKTEVVVIGAGPAGAMAAKMLRMQGHEVVVLEKTHFPRFSIGESLLPQSMQYLEDAEMVSDVIAGGFQRKIGATFFNNGLTSTFDFREKFSPGPGTTFQVQRAKFDHILANNAERAGAQIRYGHGVTSFEYEDDSPILTVIDDHGQAYKLKAEFVLDASGFGRVLPRLLGLEEPSTFPSRISFFTHVADRIPDGAFNRETIQIEVQPSNPSIWYWLIPFENGRSSVGVVARKEEIADLIAGDKCTLQALVDQSYMLKKLLRDADFDTPVSSLEGYSANVSSLSGKGYALLGNAGEFLDPVFSSGVTIALKSAHLVAPLVSAQLSGQKVNWQTEFSDPLKVGVETFKAYVSAWYDLSFQDAIFTEHKEARIKGMISSILAGYAWDQENPFVKNTERKLAALSQICR